jgi:hypothetical protein
VLSLLDKVKLKTLKRGRPRKNSGTGCEKVMIPKKNVLPYVSGVFDPKYENGYGKLRKTRGRPIKSPFPDFNRNVALLVSRKYRRLAVRWERQKLFDAFIDLGTIHIWIKELYSGIGSWTKGC